MRERMPLLEECIGAGGRMEDLILLHINHCMDNSFYMNEQLERTGARVIFTAVPYNSREEGCCSGRPCYHAREEKEGFLILKSGRPLPGREGGITTLTAAVQTMIYEAVRREVLPHLKSGKKWMLLEDGGYHYPVLKELFSEHREAGAAFLGCVEQTMSGTRNAMAARPDYPVLSVARSLYKIRTEAWFVGMRVVDKLRRMLHGCGEFMDHKEVLVLGYGIIGRTIAGILKGNGCQVTVLDSDPRISRTAQKEGFLVWRPWLGEPAPEAFLVVGTVGKPSYTREMMGYFSAGRQNRVYLASASSKRLEFEEVLPVLEGMACRRHRFGTSYRFPNGKEAVLLGNGYPVNFFDCEEESLTDSMIDPVFSEMYLLARALYEGSVQAPGVQLLGRSPFLDSWVDEPALMEKWSRKNGLAKPISLIHPQEKLLQAGAAAASSARLGLFFTAWKGEKEVLEGIRRELKMEIPFLLRERICLCMEELAVNVLRYGFLGTEEPFLGISVEIHEKEVWIALRDNGMAFDPAAAPEADVSLPAEERQKGGLGIFLVRALADEMKYSRSENENCTVLCFKRKGADLNDGDL